jgi:hypothetical protein
LSFRNFGSFSKQAVEQMAKFLDGFNMDGDISIPWIECSKHGLQHCSHGIASNNSFFILGVSLCGLTTDSNRSLNALREANFMTWFCSINDSITAAFAHSRKERTSFDLTKMVLVSI